MTATGRTETRNISNAPSRQGTTVATKGHERPAETRQAAGDAPNKGPRAAGGEQQGADGRADELVGDEEAALHAGVCDPEVRRPDDRGQQGRGGEVGKGLGRAKDEHRDEYERDVDDPGHD